MRLLCIVQLPTLENEKGESPGMAEERIGLDCNLDLGATTKRLERDTDKIGHTDWRLVPRCPAKTANIIANWHTESVMLFSV